MEVAAPLLDAPPLRRYGGPVYVRAASPAPGAAFVQAADRGFYLRLVTLFVRLVTDANVADRTLRLEYRDAEANVYDVAGNPVTYPASSTEDYSFSAYQSRGEWEVAATNLVPLHPILLPPTHDFRIAVNGIQATDQLSRIAFVVERFYPADQAPGIPT